MMDTDDLRWHQVPRRLGMAEEFLPGMTMGQFGWLLVGVGIAVVAFFWLPSWLEALRPWLVVFAPGAGLLLPRRILGRRIVWAYAVAALAYLGTGRGVYGGRTHGQPR